MAIQHLSDSEFEKVVLGSSLPVLVDFYATWCAPCMMAAPVLEELSNEYEGRILIVKVDIDINQINVQKYGVLSIPTVLLFVDGEVVDSETGFQGKAKFDSLIQKGLSLVKN